MFCKLKVSDGYTVITALPENVYRRLGSHFDSLDLANSLDLDRQDPKNLEEMMKQLAQGKLSPRDPLRNDSQREHAKAVLAAQIEADMNQFKTAIIEDPELLRLLQESPEKLDHVLEQIETQSSPDGSQTTFYKIPERKGYKLQHCCKGEVTLAFLYHDSAGLSTLANMHSFVRKCNSSSKARDQAARCLSGNDSPSTKKIGQTTVDSGNKPHTSSPQTTRGRWAWLLAGGGILILVGGAVLWLLGQRNESPEPSKPISDSKTETIGPNAHNPLQEEGTHLGPESSSLPPLPVGSPKDEQEPEEPAALMTATGA
jgi:hypothetical protein